MRQTGFEGEKRINKIDITEDNLTGRGGMALYARYLSKVSIYPILANYFGHIRKSEKGLAVWNIFKQVFCFFYDGTSRHLIYFDHLKKDEGQQFSVKNRVPYT